MNDYISPQDSGIMNEAGSRDFRPSDNDMQGKLRHNRYLSTMPTEKPDASLTKRELFAMAAMQGLLIGAGGEPQRLVCDEAIEQADALLEALSTSPYY